MHNPTNTAVMADSSTAPAEMSLMWAMSGCRSGVTWSQNLSIAVLRASVIHTPPMTMTVIAHSVDDRRKNMPAITTATVAARCIHVLCSCSSKRSPRPAKTKLRSRSRIEKLCGLSLLLILCCFTSVAYHPPLAPPPPVIPPPKPPPMLPPPKPPPRLLFVGTTIMGMM